MHPAELSWVGNWSGSLWNIRSETHQRQNNDYTSGVSYGSNSSNQPSNSCNTRQYHCGDIFLQTSKAGPWQVQAELPYPSGFHHVLDVTLLTTWILCSQTPSNEESQLCRICWISRVVLCSHPVLHPGHVSITTCCHGNPRAPPNTSRVCNQSWRTLKAKQVEL